MTTATSTVPASTAASTTGSTSSSQNAMQQLSGNFDTFLTLLTTQLKDQDPTSPMDSAQFTQQLVEYSQVEQQIDTNQNLQTLISQGQSANGSYALNYLGHAVTVSGGQGALINGQANWSYTLGAQAANTTLTVSDSNGNVVYSTAGGTAAGTNTFSWNGQNQNGTQLPDGTYTLQVSATGANGSAVSSSVTSTGVVSEVNMSQNPPTLMIGPMSVPLSSVSAVNATTTSQ